VFRPLERLFAILFGIPSQSSAAAALRREGRLRDLL